MDNHPHYPLLLLRQRRIWNICFILRRLQQWLWLRLLIAAERGAVPETGQPLVFAPCGEEKLKSQTL